ncbi:MAG: hypothetical protein H7A55_07870 [Verrucomicrobiaceae bacterium]|nr:hypothetical protein [Verrucomicrobiaceae bacterium]
MQVSWIDSEQIAPFLKALRDDVAPAPAAVAWEWQTLPDAKPGTAAPVAEADGAEDFMAEISVVEEAEQGGDPFFAPEPAVARQAVRELEAPAAPGPELDLIRSRLQSIKEKAIAAGMLRRQAPTPVEPEPAPIEEPVVESEPEPDIVIEEEEVVVVMESAEITPEVEEVVSAPEPESVAPPSVEVEMETTPVQQAPEETKSVSESLAEAFSSLPVQAPERVMTPQFSPFAIVQPAAEPEALPLEAAAFEAAETESTDSTEAGEDEYYFEVPLGSISDRLEAFAQWSMRWLGTDQMVIVDEHGDLVWGTEARASLVLSAMMAWTAALRATALSACDMPMVIHRKLQTGEMLAVIPCRTRVGDLQVAVVRSIGLADTEAGLLRQALEAALDVGPPPERSPKSEVQ